MVADVLFLNWRGTPENWKKREEEHVAGVESHNYIFKQIDVDLLKMELDTYFTTD